MKYDRKDEYNDSIVRLKTWMNVNKISQAELSRITGISQPRISKIIRGNYEFLSIDFWKKMSNIGKDYCWIKYGIN